MICICMYSLFVRFCLFYCSETIQFHSIFCWFYFCTVLGIPCLALFSYISSYFIFPIYIDLDTRFLLLLVHIISVSPSPFPMPLLSSLSPPSPLSLSLPLCASSPIYPISLSTPLSLSPPHLPHLSTPPSHVSPPPPPHLPVSLCLPLHSTVSPSLLKWTNRVGETSAPLLYSSVSGKPCHNEFLFCVHHQNARYLQLLLCFFVFVFVFLVSFFDP